MRILMVITNMWPPPVLITAKATYFKIVEELSKKGMEIHVLTAIGAWDDSRVRSEFDWDGAVAWFKNQEKKHKIYFHYLDLRCLAKSPRLFFYLSRPLLVFKSLFLIRRHKIDVIHDFSHRPIFFFRTAFVKIFTGAKTIHSLTAESDGFLSNYCYGRPATRFIDFIIASSLQIKKRLLKAGFPKGKIMFIPFGVEPQKFREKTTLISKAVKWRLGYNIPKLTKIVLLLGPLEKRKGVFLFGRAFNEIIKSHPKVMFVLATGGQPGNIENYQENKRRLLKIVSFHPNFLIIEGIHEVPVLMHAADIVVFPQVFKSGATSYPITLLEAMATAKPIVASDWENLKEVIKDSKTGLLFKKNKARDLAQKIMVLLEKERMSKKIGQNALLEVKEKYRLEPITEKYLKLFSQLEDED